jgi:hypothetical protein
MVLVLAGVGFASGVAIHRNRTTERELKGLCAYNRALRAQTDLRFEYLKALGGLTEDFLDQAAEVRLGTAKIETGKKAKLDHDAGVGYAKLAAKLRRLEAGLHPLKPPMCPSG